MPTTAVPFATEFATVLIQSHGVTGQMAHHDDYMDPREADFEPVYCDKDNLRPECAESEECYGHELQPIPVEFLVPNVWRTAYNAVDTLSAEGLGQLICGSSRPSMSLYNVHGGTWLSKYASGQDLLRDIAATTVVAEFQALLPDEA